MKRTIRTEEQIIGIFQEHEAGAPARRMLHGHLTPHLAADMMPGLP